MTNNSIHPQLHPKYRPDIDGLRAIAVLSVVAFHAFPEWISGGFIGVDIFFVISGYLISTILFENLDKDVFSFSDFYSRRIRRIFPALALVLFTCYGFGWLYLLSDDFAFLGKHIAGGAGFLSNLFLWNESGYFDGSANTKPLLHLWSLGIEEQFYIVWPVLLWLTWKRRVNFLTITVLIALGSFAINIVSVYINPVAAFYSPLSRFWELLIGAILAYVVLYKNDLMSRWIKSSDAISVLGFGLFVVGVGLLAKDSLFPGWWALLPTCGGALILLAGPKAWVNQKILSNPVLVWFGFISFPLYLWHWPLLSFAHITQAEVSLPLRAGLVLISIGLAWLTYRFIETPIRKGGLNRLKVSALVFLILLVGYLGFNSYDRKGLEFRNRAFLRQVTTYQFDKVAAQRQRTCFLMDTGDDVTNFSTKCIRRDRPIELVLWGDSVGASYYPGFSYIEERDDRIGVTQFTASGCGGLMPTNYQSNFCIEANKLALSEILKLKPNLVVISKTWDPGPLETQNDIAFLLHSPDFETAKKTIAILHSNNIPVLIIGPPPRWDKDVSRLAYKYWKDHHSLPPLFYNKNLVAYPALVDRALEQFSKENGVMYYSPYQRLCNEEGCMMLLPEEDKAPVTFDEFHPTAAAAIYIATDLKTKILDPFFRNTR